MNRLLPISIVLGITVALTGCPTEEHDEDTGVVGFPDCDAIVEACHEVDDDMPGMAHECHETAHDADSNDDCAPMRDACVAACEALDGGMHDDEDAGEHGH